MLAGMSSPHEVLDDLVRHFIAALESKDLTAACAMLAPNCEYDNVPMGPVFGPDAVRAGLEPFLGACTQVDWVIHHQVAYADDAGTGVVMNERLDRFHLGDRWIEVPVAGLFMIADGLITLWRDYFDLATYRSQMSPST
jgi:limonene-1,2-epoxide hydrolase